MRIILFIVLFASLSSFGATDYYVANTRSSNGSGTLASPWKDWSDINWTTIGTALASGPVNLYFSSRDIWTMSSTITPVSASLANILRIVGDEKYTSDATGTATWNTESSGSLAILTNNTASDVGGFTIANGTTNITISGFYMKRCFSGLNGISNPQTNINYITLSNSIVAAVAGDKGSYGIGFVFAEAGCHSFKASHVTVSNTSAESIYLGHYTYITNTMTNCLVEYCTIRNCGLVGEGEIDIKPPCNGAIVRYNTSWRDPGVTGGGQCGTVIGADNCQIYGNRFFFQDQTADTDWGYGIYVQSEGNGFTPGDGFGQQITNCLIYNNLFYSNQSAGIRLLANISNLSGIKIFNNTFAYNGRYGLELRSGTGDHTINVPMLTNNLFLENTTYDLWLENPQATITAANYNLMYRASGNEVNYQGTGKTFAQWQALGFDANGVNGNPALDTSLVPATTSPAVDIGADLSSIFTVDQTGATRTGAWDIGALSVQGSHISITTPTTGKAKKRRGIPQ